METTGKFKDRTLLFVSQWFPTAYFFTLIFWVWWKPVHVIKDFIFHFFRNNFSLPGKIIGFLKKIFESMLICITIMIKDCQIEQLTQQNNPILTIQNLMIKKTLWTYGMSSSVFLLNWNFFTSCLKSDGF